MVWCPHVRGTPLAPPANRPEIDTGNLGLAEMGAAAWGAIEGANTPPRVYRFGMALAWLAEDPAGRTHIEVMGLEHVRHHLAHIATFIRWTAALGRPPVPKPVFPPSPSRPTPRGPASRPAPADLPVRVPVFTAEGRLLTESGLRRGGGLYVALPLDLALPASLPNPPPRQTLPRRGPSCSMSCSSTSPSSVSARSGPRGRAPLTLLLRECIPGDVPLFVVSKSTPRTGAGLLVKIISLIQDGTAIAPRTISAG